MLSIFTVVNDFSLVNKGLKQEKEWGKHLYERENHGGECAREWWEREREGERNERREGKHKWCILHWGQLVWVGGCYWDVVLNYFLLSHTQKKYYKAKHKHRSQCLQGLKDTLLNKCINNALITQKSYSLQILHSLLTLMLYLLFSEFHVRHYAQFRCIPHLN